MSMKIRARDGIELVAWQWTNDADSDDVPGWLDPHFLPFEEYATVSQGERQADILPMDWVICTPDEQVIPVAMDAFDALFDLVAE